jgi:type IV secretory pathway protease TraF
MTAVSTPGTAPRPRSRLRARLVLAGLSACGLAALAWASFVHPLPRLTYNPSDSVAVGWYRVDPLDHRTGSLPRPLSVGSIVLVPLPPGPPRWLRSAATCRRAFRCSSAWARSRRNRCASSRQVRIDGVPSAAVLPADRWAGRCHPGSSAAASNRANCSCSA